MISWGLFFERNMLTVQYSTIKTGFKGRFALIADTHLGIWKDEKWLMQIVDKINEINESEKLDGVLFAGDLTYEPQITDLEKLFSPLKNLNTTVYVTLGNHDVEKPGPMLRKDLTTVLKSYSNVSLLNNDIVYLESKNIYIAGLGDNWNKEDDVEIINRFSENDNVVVIAHSPDTTLKYKNNLPDLTVSGHTHCGQLRIPFIYKPFIPVIGDFDKGLYTTKYNNFGFITCGLGEVALPVRIFNPPTIDILNLE